MYQSFDNVLITRDTIMEACTDYETRFLQKTLIEINKNQTPLTRDEILEKLLHEVIRLAILADEHIQK